MSFATTRRLKACTVCGRPSPGTRCSLHPKPARPYRTAEYQMNRALTLVEERTCWICGKAGSVEDPLTADHLIEVVNGGDSTRTNLRAAHRSCNGRRGANC